MRVTPARQAGTPRAGCFFPPATRRRFTNARAGTTRGRKRAAAMLGEAPAYSEAAIAQARKDGAAYLEELRRAGVVGTSRAVQVKGSKAGEGSLPVPKGAKILHLIRHGQGYHNLLGEIYQEMGREFSSTGTDLSTNNPYRRAEVLDPPLTELGRKQAKALRPQARRLSPELVVVSPLSRATQTALLAFSHLVNRSGSGTSATSAPFLCHEGVREQTGGHVCDACRGLEDMEAEFPVVDYSNVRRISTAADETWSDTRETMNSMADRAYDFMVWVRSRPEKEIAVASHSAFLFVLVNSVIDTGSLAEGVSAWFMTGEMRSLVVTYHDRS